MGLPRFHIEGHIYYITMVVYDRLPIFTRPTFTTPLYDSLNFYRHKLDFKLLGNVIVPDHIHLMIWPFGTATVSDIMRDYKKLTSVRLIRQAQIEGIEPCISAFQQARKKTGRSANKVWQDSFWDTNIYREISPPEAELLASQSGTRWPGGESRRLHIFQLSQLHA